MLRSNGTGREIIMAILPEILLIAVLIGYFAGISVVVGIEFLLQNIIAVTSLFVGLYAVLQGFLLTHVWHWSKKCIDSDFSKAYEKHRNFDYKFAFFSPIFVWMTSHGICVLFGAPLIDNYVGTTTWAWLVSIFISIPSLCLLGTNPSCWFRVVFCGDFENSNERLVYYLACGAVLGSWASAAVVPLDWDRPWQVWPIPGIAGAVLGYTVGVLSSCVLTIRELKGAKLL